MWLSFLICSCAFTQWKTLEICEGIWNFQTHQPWVWEELWSGIWQFLLKAFLCTVLAFSPRGMLFLTFLSIWYSFHMLSGLSNSSISLGLGSYWIHNTWHCSSNRHLFSHILSCGLQCGSCYAYYSGGQHVLSFLQKCFRFSHKT